MAGLKLYAYASKDRSIFANYVMQPFWNWSIKFVPKWIAPNLITLTGFFFILLSYFLTLSYAPTLSESLPRWLYLLNAVGLFIYQLLDALDGKQARRTKSSSPLGELFDHGCDALTTVFLSLVTATALKVGSGPLIYLNVVGLMGTFFLTAWDTYFNGILDLWYINVTEAQFFGMIIQLLPFAYGPNFFLTTVQIGAYTLTLGQLMLIPSTLTTLFFCVSSINNVFTYCLRTNSKFSTPVSYLFPILFVTILYSLWCYNSPHLLHDYVHPFCVCLGFIYSNLVGRMVTARVCRMPYDIYYIVMAPLPIGILLSFLGLSKLEVTFLYLYCAFSVVSYLHFGVCLIFEMTAYLQIKCFRIPPVKEE
uniref:Uncharacterized protein n=1 Tax=Arcella intermedia TaxID=1963864 RepID=A0A6B2L7B8_9EUKA